MPDLAAATLEGLIESALEGGSVGVRDPSECYRHLGSWQLEKAAEANPLERHPSNFDLARPNCNPQWQLVDRNGATEQYAQALRKLLVRGRHDLRNRAWHNTHEESFSPGECCRASVTITALAALGFLDAANAGNVRTLIVVQRHLVLIIKVTI